MSVTRIPEVLRTTSFQRSIQFGGTVRTYRQEVRERTRETIARVLSGVTRAHGAAYEFDYVVGYDPVLNDPRLAGLVREVAGAARVVEFDPLMAGDDFSPTCASHLAASSFVGAGDDPRSRITILVSRSMSARCRSRRIRRSFGRPFCSWRTARIIPQPSGAALVRPLLNLP